MIFVLTVAAYAVLKPAIKAGFRLKRMITMTAVIQKLIAQLGGQQAKQALTQGKANLKLGILLWARQKQFPKQAFKATRRTRGLPCM